MSNCATSTKLRLVLPTLDTIEEDHSIQRILCNDLEELADRLPELPSSIEVRRLNERIHRVVTTHFARAEQAFGLLPADRRPDAKALQSLHAMHQLDELHGQDLIVALWQHVGRSCGEVGQLAYMLRCFFDGCRRAIALKESMMMLTNRPNVMPD